MALAPVREAWERRYVDPDALLISAPLERFGYINSTTGWRHTTADAQAASVSTQTPGDALLVVGGAGMRVLDLGGSRFARQSWAEDMAAVAAEGDAVHGVVFVVDVTVRAHPTCGSLVAGC